MSVTAAVNGHPTPDLAAPAGVCALDGCGELVVGRRVDAKFCSQACNRRAAKQRHAAKVAAAPAVPNPTTLSSAQATYLACLMACAVRDPRAEHVFDRIERQLEETRQGPA